MSSTRPPGKIVTDLDLEQKKLIKTELHRILASQLFRRSDRLTRFLSFVCDLTLNGEGAELNEYLIAHRVFDRGEDYSSGEDSVVRRQAYSLRQKLQEYYACEGADDSVRIDLPVGRYVPSFHFVEATVIAPPVEPDPTIQAPLLAPSVVSKPSSNAMWVIAAAAICVLFGVGGMWIGSRLSAKPDVDPIFGEIWGPLITDGSGSVICFSNALTAGIRQIDQPFPEDTLTRGIELGQDQAHQIRQRFRLPAGGYFYMNPTMSHAKMGEALGIVPISVMFTKAGVPVRALQSRYLNWQDFRNQNLVLLGHGEANQWLEPILSKLPYRHAKTTLEKPRRIVVTDPVNGERAEYYPNYSKGQNPAAEDYALVTFINSIDERHGLAMLNGVNTEGTLMALDYMTDPMNLKNLLAQLRQRVPNHSRPWHFQAILHSELRDGVPAGIELVSLRTLP